MTRNQYIGLIVVLLLVGLLGWPTLYITKTGGGSGMRINRFTGCVDITSGGGWQRKPGSQGSCMTEEQRQQVDAEKVAATQRHAGYEMKKLQLINVLLNNSTGGLNNYDTINNYSVHLYNGSDCSIKTLTITVNGKTYVGYTSIFSDLDPYDVGDFEYKIFDPEVVQAGKNDWSIADVSYATPGGAFEDASCVKPLVR